VAIPLVVVGVVPILLVLTFVCFTVFSVMGRYYRSTVTRAEFIGFSLGIALAFGFTAQFTTICNPLLCLIGLNISEAVYAAQVFGRAEATAESAVP
jgi:sodium--glutamate symport carrier gltS